MGKRLQLFNIFASLLIILHLFYDIVNSISVVEYNVNYSQTATQFLFRSLSFPIIFILIYTYYIFLLRKSISNDNFNNPIFLWAFIFNLLALFFVFVPGSTLLSHMYFLLFLPDFLGYAIAYVVVRFFMLFSVISIILFLKGFFK